MSLEVFLGTRSLQVPLVEFIHTTYVYSYFNKFLLKHILRFYSPWNLWIIYIYICVCINAYNVTYIRTQMVTALKLCFIYTMFMYIWLPHESICLSIYLSIYLSVCLSFCLSISLYLSIYSIYLYINLFIYLCI
jgi:hypothetical protein